MVALAMMLSGLGISAFVPNLQAFISSRLPYTAACARAGHDRVLVGADRHHRAVGRRLLLIAATGWRRPSSCWRRAWSA
jgi:hypothetical protein